MGSKYICIGMCVLDPSGCKQVLYFQGLHSHSVEITIVAAEDSSDGEEENERVRFLQVILNPFCELLFSCFSYGCVGRLCFPSLLNLFLSRYPSYNKLSS